MIDTNKLDIITKMEMIVIWLESLAKKRTLSIHDKEMISAIVDYIMEEMSI